MTFVFRLPPNLTRKKRSAQENFHYGFCRTRAWRFVLGAMMREDAMQDALTIYLLIANLRHTVYFAMLAGAMCRAKRKCALLWAAVRPQGPASVNPMLQMDWMQALVRL